MTRTAAAAWEVLTRLAADNIRIPLAELTDTPGRFDTLSFSAADVLLDLSKQRLDANVLEALQALAEAVDLDSQRAALFDGGIVNQSEQRPALHTALRAHWMLAGIYSGDWGAEELKDVHKARDHLRIILAHWPQSDEAKYITSKLRWDSQAGKNRFQHLPQRNKPLLDLFES